MTDHTCSLYCERSECIRAQRDELRDKLAAESARLEWCLKRLYDPKTTYLTTEVGCGCCGWGETFAPETTGREAVDTMLRERLGVEG